MQKPIPRFAPVIRTNLSFIYGFHLNEGFHPDDERDPTQGRSCAEIMAVLTRKDHNPYHTEDDANEPGSQKSYLERFQVTRVYPSRATFLIELVNQPR